MKKNIFKILSAFTILFFCVSQTEAQMPKRLPDGSIRYPNGTIKYPNGSVRLPNGTINYPNRTKRYPPILPSSPRYPHHTHHAGTWLPPGQAKKIYGGNARDYAPGHQKKWKKNKYHEDGDHEGGKHEGKEHDD